MNRYSAICIASLCACTWMVSLPACKKEPPAPAPEAQTAPEAAAPAPQENVQPDAPEAAKPEAPQAAKPETAPAAPKDAQADAAPKAPTFNEESLAKAKARAEAKRQNLPCPQGAKLEDGICVCPAANGINAEREKCNLQPKAYPLYSNDFKCVPNFWECYQTVMCVNPKGCHTADGLHFGPYYEEGYIVGGIDTALTAYNRWENDAAICVLDRTDGMPLFSVRTPNDVDFACDQEFCPCAADTCILGELCKSGACVADNSPLPELNDDNSKEVEADSLPEYIDGMPQKTFNTDKCKGGKLYCHGLGMKPMPKPGDDYSCMPVDSLPGVKRPGLMAWVCDGNACPCNAAKCSSGEICIDGACYKK